MFTGVVKGVGPRYCPSIEDKIVRFADKERPSTIFRTWGTKQKKSMSGGHQRVYQRMFNGISSILNRGLEKAEMMNGYAIEYDMVCLINCAQLWETKKISGLFTAGQTNGTSGYEEAAGQGIIAGTMLL